MKLTPSLVKHIMRRGLRLLVDPEPTKEDRLRAIENFDRYCAHCAVRVDKGKGDLDHLLSSAQGGRNHISDRVFSCKPCNAEQKRDGDWLEFLLDRHGKSAAFEATQRQILRWVEVAGAAKPLPESTLALLETQAAVVTAAYDSGCAKVRGHQPS
jgi:hypothetical protein